MDAIASGSLSAVPVGAGRFFALMIERERIRLRKEAGEPWPWSSDEIFRTYKFTNVKREHDRTTRWMRTHWTGPNEDRPPGEIIFNCALFRYFGTTEFAEALGWQRRYDPGRVISTAEKQRRDGKRVFTGAYIIPSLGERGAKHEAVAKLVLGPLWDARQKLADIARTTRSWAAVGRRLRELPGFGGTGFMAKETLQDVMHTPVLCNAADRNTWCPVGPGARRGLNRVHGRHPQHHASERAMLSELMDLFQLAVGNMPLFMPELELHDIQFQLCEFDKYERVRLGEGRPKALYAYSIKARTPSVIFGV